MDVQEYTKQQGSFLKASDVKSNPDALYEITGEGELITNKFGNVRLHIPVKCGETAFIFDMNKTNARFAEQLFKTSDTKNWIGKMLKLNTYRTKTPDGTMTDAIDIAQTK